MIDKIIYQPVFCFGGEQEKVTIQKDNSVFQIILQELDEPQSQQTGYFRVWLYDSGNLIEYKEVSNIFPDIDELSEANTDEEKQKILNDNMFGYE